MRRSFTARARTTAVAAVMATIALGLPAGAAASPGSDRLPPTLLLVDSGKNPYHEDFRLPDGFVPPAGYYPEEAELVELTLDAGSYAEAVERDRDLWDGLQPGRLYGFAGTKIVGAIQFSVLSGDTLILDDPRPGPVNPDTGGHGTRVASSAVGNLGGSCPVCRIVMAVNPPPNPRFVWALDYDWIDALSLSFGNVQSLGWFYSHEEHEAREWARSGRAWFVAAGNDVYLDGVVNHLDDYTGTPWAVRVGRGDPPQAAWTRTYDVVGRAARPVATHVSLDEHNIGSGTSFAAPAVAGHFLMLLWEARSVLGDTEGLRDGVLARARPGTPLPATGPLSDGLVTAAELQDVLMATARSVAAPGRHPLPRELSYWWEGMGLVDEESMPDARAVLLGHADPPDKPWPGWWREVDQYARWAWGGTLAPCKTRYFDFVACLQESTWDPVGDLPGPPPALD